MSRVYLLAHRKEGIDNIIGFFTNKKLLLEAMQNIGLDKCYIQGKTKKLNVTAGSLNVNMTDKITIYFDDENGVAQHRFKALELRPNKFNPLVQHKYKDLNQDLFG